MHFPRFEFAYGFLRFRCFSAKFMTFNDVKLHQQLAAVRLHTGYFLIAGMT